MKMLAILQVRRAARVRHTHALFTIRIISFVIMSSTPLISILSSFADIKYGRIFIEFSPDVFLSFQSYPFSCHWWVRSLMAIHVCLDYVHERSRYV